MIDQTRVKPKYEMKFQSYPDEAHGLSGVQRHLYHSLDRFWDNCFKN